MKNKKAFTLAETLIVLVILGIVASLTIPALVRRQIEASNRVKIKKAMGVYETMMSKIAVENDLKSNAALQEWNTPDENGNYPVMNYLKPAKYLNDTKYQVQFSDGVACDFKYIQTPICAIKAKDLNEATAQSSTNRAFYLYAQFDNNGILRVSEPQFTYTLTTGADKIAVNASIARLYDFIDGKTSTSQEEVATPFVFTINEFSNDYSKECDSNLNCEAGECKGCTKYGERYWDEGYNSYEHDKIVYNSNGHILSYNHGCWERSDLAGICDWVELFAKDGNGNDLVTFNDCSSSGNTCNSCTNLNGGNYCQNLGYAYCNEDTCTKEEENDE